MRLADMSAAATGESTYMLQPHGQWHRRKSRYVPVQQDLLRTRGEITFCCWQRIGSTIPGDWVQGSLQMGSDCPTVPPEAVLLAVQTSVGPEANSPGSCGSRCRQ